AHAAILGRHAHQRHIEAGQPAEIGDVLLLVRDGAVQPEGFDIANTHSFLLGRRFGGSTTLQTSFIYFPRVIAAGCPLGVAITRGKREISGRPSLPEPYHRVTRIGDDYTKKSFACQAAVEQALINTV